MMSRPIVWVTLALASGMAVVGAGCASTTGPGAAPKDNMVMEPVVENYNKVTISAVEVTFDPASKDIEANPQEVQMLKDYMSKALVKQLSGRYTVVEEPGPGVMRLKVTITDVKKGEPLMHLHWATKLLGLGLGGAAMQGTLEDSTTGESLGFAFISKRGTFFQLTEGLTKWGEAKAVMDEWAKEFKKKLDEANGKK